MYDIWSPYDPSPQAAPEQQVHSDQRLIAAQQSFHVALLDLRPVIDDPQRDAEQVAAALRPFHETIDSRKKGIRLYEAPTTTDRSL